MIDWFVGGPSQKFLLEKIETETCQLSTSWICAAEFLVKAGTKEQTALFRLFETQELLLHEVGGTETLSKVADLRNRLALPLPDCIILAASIHSGAILLTRDKLLWKQGKKAYPHIVLPG